MEYKDDGDTILIQGSWNNPQKLRKVDRPTADGRKNRNHPDHSTIKTRSNI